MSQAKRTLQSLVVVLVVCLVVPGSAHAYLDPASGSILLQVLLGGLAGGVVVLKLFWHRIRGFFGGGAGGGRGDDESPV
jgi:hypothetical protein